MKIIVTHKSPDMDALTSVWLIKRFLQGWQDAKIYFVSAGSKLKGNYEEMGETVEKLNGDKVIHVDTGLGPLDHHQTSNRTISAASLTLDFVLKSLKDKDSMNETRIEALTRMVKVVVVNDHFEEVFLKDATADYHEFELQGILEGFDFQYPKEEEKYIDLVFKILDALRHNFENRVWAEKEIKEKSKEFETKFGKCMGIETINDSCLKLAQKMGYQIVIRKDPFNGKVRIKARPEKIQESQGIDLTAVYEKLKVMDPEASWYLHVSKKMLLNGSAKNPDSKASTLTLDQVIEVLKNTYT